MNEGAGLRQIQMPLLALTIYSLGQRMSAQGRAAQQAESEITARIGVPQTLDELEALAIRPRRRRQLRQQEIDRHIGLDQIRRVRPVALAELARDDR